MISPAVQSTVSSRELVAPQSVLSAVALAMMGMKGVAGRARCSTPLRKRTQGDESQPQRPRLCDSDNKGDFFFKKVSGVI